MQSDEYDTKSTQPSVPLRKLIPMRRGIVQPEPPPKRFSPVILSAVMITILITIILGLALI